MLIQSLTHQSKRSGNFIPWKASITSASIFYSAVPNLCFNGQRNHKNRSQMMHLCILSNNTFYYESVPLNTAVFLPMNFTPHLTPRTLNLKDQLCWWSSCYPLLANAEGWEPSRGKNTWSARSVKINCPLSITPGIQACLLWLSLCSTSCILQTGF